MQGVKVNSATRRSFVKELSRRGNVSAACKAARIARATAYQYRDADPDFAAAWDDAKLEADDRAEDELYRRGTEGYEKPIYQNGQMVGSVNEFSDTCLIAYLNANRSEKYRRRHSHQLEDEHGKPMSLAALLALRLSKQDAE